MDKKIRQQFVTLHGQWGIRQVHYRRAGSGPLLLMLHQSPQSSRELVSLIDRWSEYFTIVAPDSPGYGLSDPLGVDRAELSDFAAAAIEFMDAIGAGRFGVYGFHTGGMIGVALAHGYPDRVTSFACNGIVVPTEQELEEILAVYMPRFEPRWDGGHLAWAWAKNREQTIFFPWHNHTLDGRMDFPMPSPEYQQISIQELLRAGKHYHVAYRAAFTFHAERIVPELKVSGLITSATWDPIQPHLARLTDAPDCVLITKSDTLEESLERCLAQVRVHTGDGLPAIPATRPVPGRLWNQRVETQGGSVLIKRGGQDSATPVVVLHGAGGSSATVASIAAGLAETRSVLAIDLPGHGETECAPDPGGITMATCAALVLMVLDKLDLPVVELVGVEGGALLALEIANRHPDRVGRLALVHPPELDAEQADAWRESGLPSFQPDWFGGHLLHCWHMVRDSRLYFPWFQRDQQGIHWQEPELDNGCLQLEVTEYLKAEGAWQELLRDQLAYPLLDKLTVSREKISLCATPRSPWYAITETLATRTGLPFSVLPDSPAKWGAILAVMLSS